MGTTNVTLVTSLVDQLAESIGKHAVGVHLKCSTNVSKYCTLITPTRRFISLRIRFLHEYSCSKHCPCSSYYSHFLYLVNIGNRMSRVLNKSATKAVHLSVSFRCCRKLCHSQAVGGLTSMWGSHQRRASQVFAIGNILTPVVLFIPGSLNLRAPLLLFWFRWTILAQ